MMKIKLFLITAFILCIFALPFLLKEQEKDVEVLQFASWGSKSEIEIIKPLLAQFEIENPDIKIDFLHIPQNYFQKIHLLFASNLAPDVIFLNNLYLPVYANAGLLEELILVDEKKDVKDNQKTVLDFSDKDFYPKAIEALSYNENIYALPRDVSDIVVYYNKSLFDKYGVNYPSKFWTFDDLLIIAQKLTKDVDVDGRVDTWGISFEDKPPLYYLPYLMSEGGGILSDDLETEIIDFPQSRKGLKFYSSLRNKYHVAPTKAESASATMAQLFLQGKLAMQVSGRWLVPKYREDANFDWDVINFPSGEEGSVVPLDASGWAIAKSSKHKLAAKKLIEFLASRDSIEKITQSGLIVPARIDVAEDSFLNTNLSPKNARVFTDIIRTAKVTPVSVNYNEIIDRINEKTNYLFNEED